MSVTHATIAAGQRRAEDRETGPAAEAFGQREDQLGAPLLVDPREAGRGERPRIDRGYGPVGQDLAAGAQVIRQVDRRHGRQQRGEGRQGDGEEDPESVEAHDGAYAAEGASAARRCRARSVSLAKLATTTTYAIVQ